MVWHVKLLNVDNGFAGHYLAESLPGLPRMRLCIY